MTASTGLQALFLRLGLAGWNSWRKVEGGEESNIEVAIPQLPPWWRLQGFSFLCPSVTPLFLSKQLIPSLSVCLSHTHGLWGELQPPQLLGLRMVTVWLLLSWYPFEKEDQHLRGMDGLEWIYYGWPVQPSRHTLLRGREGPRGTNWVLMRGTFTLEALGGDYTLGKKMTMQYDAMELLSWLQNRYGRGRDQETALNKSRVRAGVLSAFSHVWLFVTLWTMACQAPLSMGIL